MLFRSHLTSSKRRRIDISYAEFYRFIQAYDALNSVTTSNRDILAVSKSFKKNKGRTAHRGRSFSRRFSRSKSKGRFQSQKRSFSRRRFKYLVNPNLTGGELSRVIKEKKICNKCGQHNYNGQPCRKIGKTFKCRICKRNHHPVVCSQRKGPLYGNSNNSSRNSSRSPSRGRQNSRYRRNRSRSNSSNNVSTEETINNVTVTYEEDINDNNATINTWSILLLILTL